ncbi:hypothetical protein VZT92_007199 [Zoarces viviparus]|uniref:Uncharacterized protein n=1 Tax=Zoarces viviparus TaxID=48416 RepID=A0AAW1FKE8_ZOAVI
MVKSVRKPGSGQVRWGGGFSSGAMSHVGHIGQTQTGRPAGCIMPILQALQCMLGDASKSKGGRAAPQNKASFSLTTPASMKLPTGPSTLDNPLLMLQSLLPLRPYS